jgi:hypothetical protein
VKTVVHDQRGGAEKSRRTDKQTLEPNILRSAVSPPETREIKCRGGYGKQYAKIGSHKLSEDGAGQDAKNSQEAG